MRAGWDRAPMPPGAASAVAVSGRPGMTIVTAARPDATAVVYVPSPARGTTTRGLTPSWSAKNTGAGVGLQKRHTMSVELADTVIVSVAVRSARPVAVACTLPV